MSQATFPDRSTETIVTQFRDAVRDHPDRPAIRIAEGDELVTISWGEYGKRAATAAQNLSDLGIGPGRHVVLMTANRPEFYITDVACQLIGAIPVSVYDSPSVDRLAEVLGRCRPAAILVETAAHRERALAAAAAAGIDPLLIDIGADRSAEHSVAFGDLLIGDALDLDECAERISPDDVAVMLFTSGTTSAPKGVPLTHRSLVFATWTFKRRSPASLDGARMLSYLPFAHIGERFATFYLHISEAADVTCCPRMTDVESLLRSTHPNLFFGAPRMWELLYARVAHHLEKDTSAAAAFDAVRAAHREGVDARESDRAVVFEVLAIFGLDRLRVAIVGSAPLPAYVEQFWIELGVPLGNFWGQTESTGMGTWDIDSAKMGTLGRVLDGIELRISDEGEILIKGPCVFPGYFQDPERTRETITEDGWLRTTDLGHIDEDGNLHFRGRANDIIIPTSGHNVSPIATEGALVRHPLILRALLLGTARPHIAALIQLDVAEARSWLAARAISATGSPVDIPEVRAEIQAAVDEINADLPGAERVRRFILVADEWHLDSDLLTATGKIKRGGVVARYLEDIDLLYAHG